MSFVGKYVLAGITYLDSDGNVADKIEVHGRIIRVDEAGIVFEQANGEEFALPPDTDSLKPARPGVYHLKTIDETVENPDYVSVWTVTAPEDNDEHTDAI